MLAATEATEAEGDSDSEPEPILTINDKLAEAQRAANEVKFALAAAMANDHQPSNKKANESDLTPSPTRRHNSTKHQREKSPAKIAMNSNSPARGAAAREEVVAVEAGGEAQKPVKRTRVPKRIGAGGMRRSKRRSTLSPEELEGLMGL